MISEKNRQLLSQLFRFALVGAIGFIVNALLVELLALYTGPVVAQLLAFPVAATSTWLMNRRFTFAATAPASFSEWRKYLLANTAGMVANNGFYFLTVLSSDFAYKHPVIGVAAGSVAGLFFNFVATRAYVFKARSDR